MSKSRIETYGSTVDLLGVDTDGALKKVGRDVLSTGVGTALNVTAGTWTPSYTNLSGLTGTPTTLRAVYEQTGSLVRISMVFYATLTGVGPTRTVDISLPVAPSANFSTGNEARGIANGLASGASTTGLSGYWLGNTGAKTVRAYMFTAVSANSLYYMLEGAYDL